MVAAPTDEYVSRNRPMQALRTRVGTCGSIQATVLPANKVCYGNDARTRFSSLSVTGMNGFNENLSL